MTAQELKNSILQLAIQGKLVKQDPNDEPASVLLERIKEEREKLIKEKKIKKEKYSEIYKDSSDNHYYEKFDDGTVNDITDEIPFDIPDNWKWVRLKNLSDIYTGNSIPETVKKEKYSNVVNGYAYIGTKDVNFDSSINYDNGIKIPFEAQKFKIAHRNSTLLCIEGGSAGRKIGYLDQDVCFGNKLATITSFIVNSKYIFYVLQSTLLFNFFKINITGIIGGVSINKLKTFIIPLPPLKEQQRIIEKYENILPYISRHDDIYKRLEKLNNSYKEELKKTILQYAIQGKLVKQDSNDEPANILINKILDEKRELIKSKKIKKQNLSVIYKDSKDNQFYEKFDDGTIKNITDEIPFEIPDNWAWTKLKNVGIYKKGPFGSALTKNMFVTKSNDTIKVYEQKNAIQKNANLGNYYITKEYFEKAMSGFEVFPNDIIVSCAGTIGETYVMPKTMEKGIINQALMRMRISELFPIRYFLLYFDYVLKKSSTKKSNGSAIKNIPPFNIFKEFLVAVPPIVEQRKILDKLDLLFNIIEAAE